MLWSNKMNQIPNRMVTAGASRKRKDRDTFYKPSVVPKAAAPVKAGGEQVASNRLLAGYLAHEFLSKGTLLGQKFDPARSEAEAKKWKKGAEAESEAGTQESYAEVASILNTYGAHIPGIVNPTQLGRWIKK